MQDATFWAQQLKNKTISFPELATQIQQKITQQDQTLGAMVTFELADALAMYEQLSPNETLFGGVPLPLKMLGQNKAGWLATASSRLLADYRVVQTDAFVESLMTAGFVPLGQTNTPEFGFKNVTDPTATQVTRNPWNTAYSAGGSSGGAAAAVAAGFYPIAGASDGGGSIRIPASFCSLIGLKPTRGTMPVGPGNLRGWQGASINFALTVSMRDTMSLYYQMRQSQPAAPYQAPLVTFQQDEMANQQKLRIAYTTQSPIGTKVDEDAQIAVQAVLQKLATQGHEIVEVALPYDGVGLMEQYYAMNGAETAAMFADLSRDLQRPLTNEDMEPMTWGIYQYGEKIPARDYVHSLQYWDQVTVTMENLLTEYDLLLTPTAATTAPAIATDLQSPEIRQALAQAESLSVKEGAQLVWDMFEKSLAITPFTQLANLTGQPALSLPTHIATNGLPIGVQFQAARGREDLLFQVGCLLEDMQTFKLPTYYQS